MTIRLAKNIFNHFYTDSLYRNSLYLMMSTFVTAFFGFFFWLITTRLYTTAQIGIATSLISISALIAGLSGLGLNQSVVKYLPESDNQNSLLTTIFILVSSTALIITVLYLMGITIFTPGLQFLVKNNIFIFLFLVFMIVNALNSSTDGVFIAYRAAIFILIYDCILSIVKLTSPFFFFRLGSLGIYISYCLAVLTALLLSFYFLQRYFHYTFTVKFNVKIVKKIIKFSFANYLTNLMTNIPVYVIPLIIVNKLGPDSAAFYYIDMMIANLIYVIPVAACQSLFAEGSYSAGQLKFYLQKAIKIIALFLTPAVVTTLLFGKYILFIFGKNYMAEGNTLLILLVLSSVFITINNIVISILKIKNKKMLLIVSNVCNILFILFFINFFTTSGLRGIGIGWIISQFITSLLYICIVYINNILS